MAQAYCVKCKKKVEVQNAKKITMKNKRPAVQGVCPNCGTKVFRIGQALTCG
jgi:DNA-directed RNA polymerase subunit RPC12/RpoP